jgi:hypothetical protein
VPHQQTFTVDRRTNLSYREFVHDYLMPQKPVIIADGLTAWPALSKWTPQFFKTEHGDKQVTVNGAPMRLGDYIDLVLHSSAERPCPYLSGVMVRQQFPEIADDILPELKYTLPDRLRSPLAIGKTKSRLGLPELLISGLGGRFSLHVDALFLLGFVTQIHGDKEFMIFAPSDTPYLYPRPGDEKHSDIVSPFDVDLDKFPLFAKATPARFVLKPGETIFNPAGWWHATKILSPSIAMVISTANASNWSAYADDLARPRAGVPRLFTAAMRSYLGVTGGMLSLQEALFPVRAD